MRADWGNYCRKCGSGRHLASKPGKRKGGRAKGPYAAAAMTCSGSRLQAGRAFYRWPHARSGPGIVMLAIFGSVRRSVINGVIPANAGIQQAAASRQGHNCLCNTGSPVECVAGHPRLSGPGTARMASFRPPLEREDRRAPRSEARRGGVNSQIAADVERSPHPASHLASLVARPPSPSRGGGQCALGIFLLNVSNSLSG